jgi:3',5'-cyclic AMP phosphodiesterase CpdA
MKSVMKRLSGVVFFAMTILFFLGSPPWADENIKFAVFSDPHVYDSSLGTEGSAFEAYLVQDRKLIRESEAILDATIESILKEKDVQFVIIPGDLTKDGEKKSHHLFAKKLKKLEKAGVEAYVIPGNHDINNPHAYRYYGDNEIPVPYVSPKKFKTIYKKYGYKEALYEDPNSLSYVAEPVPGLWLIAMDPCIYDNNIAEGKPVTGGEFKTETLAWILARIGDGKAAGKQMIGMMHHGVIEHYTGQSILFADYVVKDWLIVAPQLATAGLNVVFSGHYHSNDVTKMEFGGNFMLDVETGSLVTYPCPYRVVTLSSDNELGIESRFIEAIDYDTGGLPFPAYAEAYLTEGLTGIAYFMLITDYGLPEGEPTLTMAMQLADAFKAHYAGDELPDPVTMALIYQYYTCDFGNLGITPGDLEMEPDQACYILNLIGQYLGTLWTDLPPADTSVTIDLN